MTRFEIRVTQTDEVEVLAARQTDVPGRQTDLGPARQTDAVGTSPETTGARRGTGGDLHEELSPLS
jgi:hypothetical protein